MYFSQSSLATDNSGALPLFTGETITSANTIYPEFYNWVSAHTELQCTSAEYESALTTYGECAKYVIGSGSLRLPLIKNYIKAANPSEGIKNIEAGLPNITGVKDSVQLCSNSDSSQSGALYSVSSSSSSYGGSGDWKSIKLGFDASRSSAVYGKSSTVTPASTTLYPWVVAYTAAIPASTAQAAEFQQALSGKADTSLSNLSTAGKALASGLGMPSSRYINLTLGASGSTYTAPANGWFNIVGGSKSGNKWVNVSNGIYSMASTSISGVYNAKVLYPVKKGDIVTVSYTLDTDNPIFRFIYAEGSKSEAN